VTIRPFPAAGSADVPVRTAVSPARLEAHVLRWPVRTPVRTSFGTMHDRPMVLVRVEDVDGAVGWGEAWCNFPSCGAEHRARIVETVLAPLAVGRTFASAGAAWRAMTEATAVLAIQAGEPGPLAQALAAVDTALHDLAARRAGLPLWRLLGGTRDAVTVYASGVNPDGAAETVARAHAEGHRAFKLKIGFGAKRDHANLRDARTAIGDGLPLMVDANQAWSIDEALAAVPALAAFELGWLEEPLRADRPLAEWQRLAAVAPMPLAAGENVQGDAAFDALVASGAIGVVQPDLAKWGGPSAMVGAGDPDGRNGVADRIVAAGLRWCPHYLGGGIGLLASAHVLAARGGPGGWLEVDVNENPLRTELCPPLAGLRDGAIALGDAPGLGFEPDLAVLRRLCSGST
jgi:L-alanine-DL-glutamate epimerase-like enolase superfamily enzyme